MASLHIELTITGLDAALARLNALGRVAEHEELLDSLGGQGVAQTQRRIEREKTTPDGTPWKANKEGTSILFRDGWHLHDSIDRAVQGAHRVVWGSGWIGARVHQFGAVIRPVKGKALVFMLNGEKVFAKQVKIPAREYLGVSADNARELEHTAARFVEKVLQ